MISDLETLRLFCRCLNWSECRYVPVYLYILSYIFIFRLSCVVGPCIHYLGDYVHSRIKYSQEQLSDRQWGLDQTTSLSSSPERVLYFRFWLNLVDLHISKSTFRGVRNKAKHAHISAISLDSPFPPLHHAWLSGPQIIALFISVCCSQ